MSEHILLAALLMFAAGTNSTDSGIPSTAPNCSLQAPPSQSGEVEGDEKEFDLRVFPRQRDFPTRYTGCQVSWSNANGRWQLFAVAYFEAGKPVVFFGPSAAAGRKTDLVCRYHRGKLVAGDDKDCPDASQIVLASMPAGCLERIRSGTRPKPPECEDE
jgi:hypothetical protein